MEVYLSLSAVEASHRQSGDGEMLHFVYWNVEAKSYIEQIVFSTNHHKWYDEVGHL